MLYDFVSIYDNAVSTEDCEKMIYVIEELNNKHLMFQDEAVKHRIDQKAENLSQDYSLQAWSSLGKTFFNSITDYVSSYMEQYTILKQDKFLLYDIKVKKIPIGGGFHAWHYENGSLLSASRSFVVQLYLNTIAEGGETEFLYVNKRVKAKQGRLIIFPAGYTHTHRGNPPIGQDKYIITSWGLVQE